MSISRVVARPMLSAIFVAGGLDALRHPETKVPAADAVVQPVVEQVPILPRDTEALVKLNAAVQIGAGLLLATGKLRRLAALALIGSIIPTTYAGHRFWEETDDATRAQQRVHFLKNMGLLGGLMLAATDTEGAPSLSWRAKTQTRRLGDLAAVGQAERRKRAAKVARRASRVQSKVKGEAKVAAEGAAQKAEAVRHKAEGAVHKAEEAVHKAEKAIHKAEGAVHRSADLASTQMSASAERAAERAKDLLAKAHERLPVG
jgi:putative oxidoreductase